MTAMDANKACFVLGLSDHNVAVYGHCDPNHGHDLVSKLGTIPMPGLGLSKMLLPPDMQVKQLCLGAMHILLKLGAGNETFLYAGGSNLCGQCGPFEEETLDQLKMVRCLLPVAHLRGC